MLDCDGQTDRQMDITTTAKTAKNEMWCTMVLTKLQQLVPYFCDVSLWLCRWRLAINAYDKSVWCYYHAPATSATYCLCSPVLVMMSVCTHITGKRFQLSPGTFGVDVHSCSVQYGDWYTGRWRLGCYIWYSEEGSGRSAAPSSPHFSLYQMYNSPPINGQCTNFILFDMAL